MQEHTMSKMTELLQIMQRLRHPEHGCPWDKAQTMASIAPFTQEEVYELIEAIEVDDMDGLCDELGDLLFHIVFYAQMAQEQGLFDFGDIVNRACEKLKRRHPHIFSAEGRATTESVRQDWERIKQQERLERHEASEAGAHYLDGISKAQPALLRALRLQKRAAAVGFDWQGPEAVLDKVEEELGELREERRDADDTQRLFDEIGDLLFAVINCARHLEVDPEQALRAANRKFETRFNYIEDQLGSQQGDLQSASLDEMEALWQEAKARKEKMP